MKFLKDITDIKGKRVLLRVDFNVPVKNETVLDDTRLFASIPTINYLREHGARVIIIAHMGRPGGHVVDELRLHAVAQRLELIGNMQVKKVETWIGPEVTRAVADMRDGDVLMLENIRFSADEEKNTGSLARDLAALGDIFVLDGFAVAHRAAASVTGISQFLPAYAGFLLEKEIEGLNAVMRAPAHPFVAVVGGAKMETKIPVIDNFIHFADHILLGGAIVNTYFAGSGYGIGDSLFDAGVSKKIIANFRHQKIVMPVDVVVGRIDGSDTHVVEVPAEPVALCAAGEGIYDIGPKTLALYGRYIAVARTLVMNGAMGYFEQPPYNEGTMAVSRVFAHRAAGDECYAVIGGGETLQAMDMTGMIDEIDVASTGGGAMLEYLSGKVLPGIAALEQQM